MAFTLGLGAKALDFNLPATDGKRYRLSDFADADYLVVFFTCNHCPYVQAWEDRIVQIQADYADRGVQVLAVSDNDAEKYPADSFPKMKERAQDKEFNFPYLFDESQEVAGAYGAERTPEVFLFGREGTLLYHGSVDDHYDDPKAVKNHYLRDALDAALADEEPPIVETRPIGCTIKWRKHQ